MISFVLCEYEIDPHNKLYWERYFCIKKKAETRICLSIAMKCDIQRRAMLFILKF